MMITGWYKTRDLEVFQQDGQTKPYLHCLSENKGAQKVDPHFLY